MIVGQILFEIAPHSKTDCYLSEFSFEKSQWQPHFTTKLLYFTTLTKQGVFPLLLNLFHLNGASERNVIPRSDEKALSYSNSMVQSKVKVQKILSQPRDI